MPPTFTYGARHATLISTIPFVFQEVTSIRTNSLQELLLYGTDCRQDVFPFNTTMSASSLWLTVIFGHNSMTSWLLDFIYVHTPSFHLFSFPTFIKHHMVTLPASDLYRVNIGIKQRLLRCILLRQLANSCCQTAEQLYLCGQHLQSIGFVYTAYVIGCISPRNCNFVKVSGRSESYEMIKSLNKAGTLQSGCNELWLRTGTKLPILDQRVFKYFSKVLYTGLAVPDR